MQKNNNYSHLFIEFLFMFLSMIPLNHIILSYSIFQSVIVLINIQTQKQ